MIPFNVSAFFNENTLGQPATYINAAGTSKEIVVVANLDEANSPLGDVSVTNQAIRVKAMTEDVPDANKSGKIILHELLIDESGEPIVDENGDQFQAEGVYSLNIINVFPDNSGITVIMCCLN